MQKQPLEMFSVKKVFVKNSQNSQENNYARIFFVIKLQATVLQVYSKRNSKTGVFLWILRNFSEHQFKEHLRKYDSVCENVIIIDNILIMILRWVRLLGSRINSSFINRRNDFLVLSYNNEAV